MHPFGGDEAISVASYALNYFTQAHDYIDSIFFYPIVLHSVGTWPVYSASFRKIFPNMACFMCMFTVETV